MAVTCRFILASLCFWKKERPLKPLGPPYLKSLHRFLCFSLQLVLPVSSKVTLGWMLTKWSESFFGIVILFSHHSTERLSLRAESYLSPAANTEELSTYCVPNERHRTTHRNWRNLIMVWIYLVHGMCIIMSVVLVSLLCICVVNYLISDFTSDSSVLSPQDSQMHKWQLDPLTPINWFVMEIGWLVPLKSSSCVLHQEYPC